MFIRKKKNNSGSVSVQIIQKVNSKSKVVETVGCSKDEDEIEKLFLQGQERVKELEPNLFDVVQRNEQKQQFLSISNDQIVPIGDELFFGKLFDEIWDKDIFRGLYKIKEKTKLFKALVLSRILYPGSKLYLSDYLHYFKKEDISDESIYRFVDTIYKDEIKEKEVFEGNRFEGNTLIDLLMHFQKRFKLKEKPIVVADRGMLNNNNIALLENGGYRYILGARIKNISHNIKEQIANLTFINDSATHEIPITKAIKYKALDKQGNEVQDQMDIKQRLILSYSTKRAKKDSYLRQKALQRLEQRIKTSPSITKSDLKLSPYAKLLDTDNSCNITFKLNKEKIKADEKLDGIKGFLSNDDKLKHHQIIEHYQNLWHIEKAFRISKTDLQIRPIYHRLQNRIKAHVLISFVAYAIYKEFEIKTRNIKQNYKISNKILRDLIKHVFAFNIDGKLIPTKLSKIQQDFYDALNS